MRNRCNVALAGSAGYHPRTVFRPVKAGEAGGSWINNHSPPGAKSYSKTKPIRIEEFELEKRWWNKRKETEYAWKVSAKTIRDGGYNLDLKNPNTPEAGHDDPEELMADYQKLLTQIATTRNALRDQLAAALSKI